MMSRTQKNCSIERGRSLRTQQGLVLEVVLVVLVALLLAAVGLFRSTDTSTNVAGNVAFKRDAEHRAQLALDDVLFWLASSANYQAYIAAGTDCPTCNYSSRMLETDGKGIPVILSGKLSVFDSAYTRAATVQMDTENVDGIRVRYLLERMCTRTGTPTLRYCTMTEDLFGGTQPIAGPVDPLLRPMLRLSVRVDGPRNTVAYSQIMIDP